MPPPIQAKAPARRKPQKHLAVKLPRKYDKPSLAKHALRALLIWLALVAAANAWAQSNGEKAGDSWGQSVLNAPAAQLPLTSSSVCGIVTPTGATNRAPCVDISGGNITSVGLALPDIFSVTGSPLTGPGTITATLVPQGANAVFAGPGPSFRALTSGDLPPTIAYTNVNNSFNGTQTLTNLTVTGTCSGCTGSGAVNSVTGTSGQITASPTSGAVILGLPATITANETFSGALTFSGSIAGSGLTNYLASPAAIGGTVPAAGNFTTLAATGNLTTNITGSTQCIHASSAGVLSGTGVDCGSGGGGLPMLTNGQVLGNATGSTTTATATNLVAGSGVTITASGGNLTIGASGSGGVSGPGSSVNTDLASWNGTGGNALADSGILLANVVQTSRTISTTAPLTGGGNLASNLNLGITIPTANLLGGSGGNFTSITAGTCLSLSGSTLNGTCTGSVTSVGLALPASVFAISGSPVTSTGTLTGSFNNQATNSVFAGPGSGPSAAPGFRSLIAADLPSSGVTPGSYTTANITVNAEGQVTAASAGAGATTITLAPGLATTPGTYNSGTQTAVSGSTLSPQLFYKAEASSCVLNSTCNSPSTNDSALLPTPTAGSVTITLPAPGSVGTAGYQIGYDAVHSYSVTTPSGTIYGCGTTGATVSGITFQSQFISDGTNWQCGGSGGGGGGSVSIAAATPNILLTPSTITGSGTIATQVVPDVQSGGSYAIAAGDNTEIIKRTFTSAAMTDTLPNVSTTGFGQGFSTMLCTVTQSDTISVTAPSTFKGSSTISLPAQSCVWISNPDGTNYTGFIQGLASVGLTAPAWLTVSNSPLTANGTIAITGTSESANLVLASPNGSSGAVTPRALVQADLPSPAGSTNIVTFQSGTSYTFNVGAGGDCNTTVHFTATTGASQVTATVPNSAPVGCDLGAVQDGTLKVVITPAGGATMHSAHSFTGTFGQFAGVVAHVYSNVGGTAAILDLFGDGS